MNLNEVKNIFESCFICHACVKECPEAIDIPSMIIKSKIDIANEFGISWYKRFYIYLSKNRKMMDYVILFCKIISPIFFKKNEDKLRTRFKVSKFGKRTFLPFESRSFLNIYQKKYQNPAFESKNKVAIFIGCLSNYHYIEVGKSLLKILEKLQINVYIPNQECCGASAYFSGDIKSVYELAKKNIDILNEVINKVDAILIPESTCASMIIKNWKRILEDEGDESHLEKLNKIIPKIYLSTDFLYTKTNILKIMKKRNIKVTYHDPCHARKTLNKYKEVRELINAGYELVELEDSSRCCGFGGLCTQSDKYALAYSAGIPKAKNILETKAKIVSAECNACRMQLNNALDNAKAKNVIFKHPLELISQSI